MSKVEVKPMYAFTETENEARFDIVIDGLRVVRRISRGFKKHPENGVVLNEIFQEQAFDFAFEFHKSISNPTMPNIKIYRFQIKRLPTTIYPEKTKIRFDKDKIVIVLHKKEKNSWRQFNDCEYETVHLVQQ